MNRAPTGGITYEPGARLAAGAGACAGRPCQNRTAERRGGLGGSVEQGFKGQGTDLAARSPRTPPRKAAGATPTRLAARTLRAS